MDSIRKIKAHSFFHLLFLALLTSTLYYYLIWVPFNMEHWLSVHTHLYIWGVGGWDHWGCGEWFWVSERLNTPGGGRGIQWHWLRKWNARILSQTRFLHLQIVFYWKETVKTAWIRVWMAVGKNGIFVPARLGNRPSVRSLSCLGSDMSCGSGPVNTPGKNSQGTESAGVCSPEGLSWLFWEWAWVFGRHWGKENSAWRPELRHSHRWIVILLTKRKEKENCYNSWCGALWLVRTAVSAHVLPTSHGRTGEPGRGLQDGAGPPAWGGASGTVSFRNGTDLIKIG